MKRCRMRWEPNAPNPQPATERMNVIEIGAPPPPVRGSKNAGVKPASAAALADPAAASATVISNRPNSISSAWNTSVRDTARNPPMRV